MADGTPVANEHALDVLVAVQKPSEHDWHRTSEEQRQMARAAIRVAMRHGATDKELMAEYEAVKEVERSGR